MKDLLIVGGMALAVYLLMSQKSGGPVSAGPMATKIIEVAGWQYFTDGTVIGPDGSYYFKGDKVMQGHTVPAAWSPAPGQGDGMVYL